ncbi:MAG: class I tRNA ligase family protein, partial [Streptosporangiaceae bacterium]|nr:class I tRNA ligase family protein [Streptosporangiaceae bacterium]
ARDFALWKAAKPGEPWWETPWGPGRPGWHLECSAMAIKYLGSAIDVHGGGLDLVFPHHENEIAQSVSAGDPFARYWLHNGLVDMSGQKMSKSLGNFLLVTEVLTQVRPQELRYYLGQAHYRSALEYSEDALDEAVSAYQRIERFVTRAREIAGEPPAGPGEPGTAGAEQPAVPANIPASFAAALDDDLSVPAALAALHATVRDGNQAIASGNRLETAESLAQARAMLAVLGLDPLDGHWAREERGGRLQGVVGTLVGLALQQREAARTRRDYAAADSIRSSLERVGVVVEDTPEGPRWELKP